MDINSHQLCPSVFNIVPENKEEYELRSVYKLVTTGNSVAPRGMPVLEIENFNYTFSPFTRFVNFESRKFKLNYVKEELKWYLTGDRFDLSICKYASMWEKLIQADGSIYSNYGQYIFGNSMQFLNVIEILKSDMDSRRAVIMILQPYHIMNDKDVCCTESLAFRIRNGKLNMTVTMRSQDCHFGFASDLPIFSFIQEMIYVTLRDLKYPDLQMGNLHLRVDSFHLYERNWVVGNKIAFDNDTYVTLDCPRIHSKDEVYNIIDCKFKTLETVPEEWKFTRWLNENN